MPVGFFISGRCWQQSNASAKDQNKSRKQEEVRAVPISALLARIRKLIPINHEDHYEEIVRGFGNGALRPPRRRSAIASCRASSPIF